MRRMSRSETGSRSGFIAEWRAGWSHQGWPVRVLRAFLGATFVYAGVQKLSDPGYLHPGASTYIGDQLRGFAQGSPIGFLLDFLAGHFAVAAGIATAGAEITIGVATLAGVAPALAAVGGLLLNLTLFLSATWRVRPYFLGADLMYAVGWLALLAGLLEQRSPRLGRSPLSPDRRRLLRGAVVGGAAIGISAIAAAIAGEPQPAPRARGPKSGTATGGGGAAGGSPAGGRGRVISNLSDLRVGQAVEFRDPSSGRPAVLLRPRDDDVVAYSRICTHAGCTVAFDPGLDLLTCPCHGSVFDPARGAAVVAGPAPRPLARIPLEINRESGDIVAQ